MKKHTHQKVQSRNETFVDRTATRIWGETPCNDNPYIAQSALCHGYDLYELMSECSFIEVFYLLFRGELPSKEDSKLLEALMIGLINPGPRHPATRAAMNAGVGKTLTTHILPIASSVMGGDYLGGGEIEPAMRFLRKNKNLLPADCAQTLLKNIRDEETKNANIVAPGFGDRFGGIDVMTQTIAKHLLSLNGTDTTLHWANQFVEAINPSGYGWLPTGLAAAVLTDLGFLPKAGGTLFQLISAPGLAAHGIELSGKHYTSMPFVPNENYTIES